MNRLLVVIQAYDKHFKKNETSNGRLSRGFSISWIFWWVAILRSYLINCHPRLSYYRVLFSPSLHWKVMIFLLQLVQHLTTMVGTVFIRRTTFCIITISAPTTINSIGSSSKSSSISGNLLFSAHFLYTDPNIPLKPSCCHYSISASWYQ